MAITTMTQRDGVEESQDAAGGAEAQANATAVEPERPLDQVDVLVIGAGFAGLGMAIALKRAGERDFVVLEKGDGVGGTWRENTYPGCACDVQSHLYSFSFAPNPEWSRMYAPQPEIRAYLDRCVQRYGIGPHIRLRADVTGGRFDERSQRWLVEVNGQLRYSARVVVAGFGALSRPELPAVPGLESFRGPSFHSAQWRHDVPLAGRRVALVGTGASAIQIVPRIAPQVARLKLFQRTPPWVLPKPDRRITRLEQRLFARHPALQRAYRSLIYWRLETRVLGFTLHPRVMKGLELLGRAHIRRAISDPQLRAKVTPSFMIGCKRILMDNDYYPALARDNVEVITGGVAGVTERGVLDSQGAEHEVDVIIYATGFRVHDPLGAMRIVGRDGLELGSLWRERGLEAYLGTTVAGFPNLFILIGPNTGLGHSSMIYMIESQVRYVLEALRTMRSRGLGAVDVRSEAQRRFNERLQTKLRGTVWSSGCSSWYLDASGRNRTLWPGFTFSFRRATRRFRLEDYERQPLRARALAGPPQGGECDQGARVEMQRAAAGEPV